MYLEHQQILEDHGDHGPVQEIHEEKQKNRLHTVIDEHKRWEEYYKSLAEYHKNCAQEYAEGNEGNSQTDQPQVEEDLREDLICGSEEDMIENPMHANTDYPEGKNIQISDFVDFQSIYLSTYSSPFVVRPPFIRLTCLMQLLSFCFKYRTAYKIFQMPSTFRRCTYNDSLQFTTMPSNAHLSTTFHNFPLHQGVLL